MTLVYVHFPLRFKAVRWQSSGVCLCITGVDKGTKCTFSTAREQMTDEERKDKRGSGQKRVGRDSANTCQKMAEERDWLSCFGLQIIF